MAWSIVQKTGTNNAGPSNPLTLTIPSTGTGNMLVAMITGSTNAITINSVSDGTNNFTQCIGAQAVDTSGQNFADIWYLPSSTSGKTTLTVNLSGTATFWAIYYYEIKGMHPVPFDKAAVVNTGNDTGGTANGPTLSPSTQGDFICGMYDGSTVTGLGAGSEFTLDDASLGGASHFTKTNASTASHQLVWTTSGSTDFCASMAAFIINPVVNDLLIMFR